MWRGYLGGEQLCALLPPLCLRLGTAVQDNSGLTRAWLVTALEATTCYTGINLHVQP